jgi:two-component system NtrC family sensor kinase
MASAIVTVFVTFIQLFYDYRRERDEIDLTFHYIEKSYQGVIAAALWNVDLVTLQRIDSGLRDLPNIDYLAITFDQENYEKPSPDKNLILHQVELYFTNGNQPQFVGRILMGSHINRVYDKLARKLLVILAAQGSKTFLVAAFMLYVFERLIMTHLRRIAAHARGLRLTNHKNTAPAIYADRAELRGELKDVVDALQEMQNNMQQSYCELEEAEARLRKLNISLEEEVHRRIQENERQQLLIQTSARLSALGEMAGNIAHEINNPLTIIAGYVRIIRSHLGSPRLSPEKLAFFGQKVETTVARITAIVSGLLRLSGNGTQTDLRAFGLNEVMLDAANLCRMKFHHQSIRFELTVPDDPITVKCRPVEIAQIIINFLNNAFDAVKNQPEPWIALRLSAQNGGAMIAVLDNGPGVPPAIRTRIMEPFFSTKNYGAGTGLGLSISRAIAQQHGGRIYLDECRMETCFVLELPLDGLESRIA